MIQFFSAEYVSIYECVGRMVRETGFMSESGNFRFSFAHTPRRILGGVFFATSDEAQNNKNE